MPKELGKGVIGWVDLTVANAEEVRDFYAEVVGWTITPVEMEGYHDYCMNDPVNGVTQCGICHAKGPNKNLPPQWLIYITVEDIHHAVSRVKSMGGEVLKDITHMGEDKFCIIRDPGGAVSALYEKT